MTRLAIESHKLDGYTATLLIDVLCRSTLPDVPGCQGDIEHSTLHSCVIQKLSVKCSFKSTRQIARTFDELHPWAEPASRTSMWWPDVSLTPAVVGRHSIHPLALCHLPVLPITAIILSNHGSLEILSDAFVRERDRTPGPLATRRLSRTKKHRRASWVRDGYQCKMFITEE
jgi:hypothetical protein